MMIHRLFARLVARSAIVSDDTSPSSVFNQESRMPLNITTLTDEIAFAAQLAPADLAELARLGIRSVINNQPDGEGGTSQPGDAELRAAADVAGLFYAYLPVPAEGGDARAVSRMRALVGELPKPLLAFCRTGERSARLYRAACATPAE